jgi:6-methylsalicylate decarboxylase
MTIDLHQHLWPEPFLRALRARTSPPCLDGWTLTLAEGAYEIDPAAHDVEARLRQAREDALDVVCVAPSAALGIDEALAGAWLDAALDLPHPFRAWAATRDPAALEGALERGAVGLELRADALAAPGGLDRLAPLLAVLDEARRPVLVHPGPPGAVAGRPDWWTPVVPYVAQLHAAWWAWADGGRERFPDLPICFAALAGLGPLHGERHRARGGVGSSVDSLTFVETSSYGTQAVDATIRVLGIDVVCFGSDRPYADAAMLGLDGAAMYAIRTRNAERMLSLSEVPA